MSREDVATVAGDPLGKAHNLRRAVRAVITIRVG